MRFSVMIWPHSAAPIEPVVELAQVAEQEGFDTVYIGDSQMIFNDVWVTLTACALATERVRLGPGVSPMVTRHPTVNVNAAISLNMVSNGRSVLGVASGDSALRTIGLSPAPLKYVREMVPIMRDLMEGKELDVLPWYNPRAEAGMKQAWGVVDKMQMLAPEEWLKPVPIEWAVLRPQAAEVAAEVSDGVIVTGGLGTNVDGAKVAVEVINRGAKNAGRDPADVRIIACTEAAIDDDTEAACDQVRHTAARLVANVGWLPDTIKDRYADAIKDVRENYQFYDHLDVTAEHRKMVPDDLAQTVCVAGSPDDCIKKCKEMKDAGITDLAIFATGQDLETGTRTLQRFAREVIPNV